MAKDNRKDSRKGKNPQKAKENYDTVKAWVESPAMQEMFQRTLPRHLSAGSWTGAALAYVRVAKDLTYCEPLSILGGLITVSSLGVRLDSVMGHAYFTARPIWEKINGQWVLKCYEAQVQIGYKGLLDLAYRNSEIQEIESVLVYKGDDFNFQKGTEQFLKHRWSIDGDRGDIRAVYAGVRFKSGYYSFQPYEIERVMQLRENILTQNGIRIETKDGAPCYQKYIRTRDDWEVIPTQDLIKYPWIGHLEAMIQKTAVRWAYKYWPTINNEFSRAAELVSIDEAGLSQGLANMGAQALPQSLRNDAVVGSRDFNPGNDERTKIKSAMRGKALTEMMLAEATKGTTKAAQTDIGARSEKAVPDDSVKGGGKKEAPPGANNGGDKNGGDKNGEPSDAEKAKILEAERLEYEANKRNS